MSAKRVIFALLAVLAAGGALASGFALYEPSALSHAMGGALVGRAMDASANFNNPATLTDLTNATVTIGFVTEHPRGRVHIHKNGESLGEHGMEPGMFTLPHFQASVPLPYNFAFGLGISPEYGLGTKFSDGWAMKWSTQETTIQSLVINPNIAYKILDNWSVGAGIRWIYFDFEQTAQPTAAYNLGSLNPLLFPAGSYNCGSFKHHLHGDNDFKDWGWQVGTKYDVTDTFSIGLVYKSAIDVHVRGHSDARYAEYNEAYGAYSHAIVNQYTSRLDGDAACDLTLPQSITGGFNWDITDDWHLGYALSWTEWSTIDTLDFDLNGSMNPRRLGWEDTWRSSFGLAYDVTDDWTAMISYVYDMDSTSSDQSSAMLPRADRHIAGCGLTWRAWRGLEFTLSYTCIFMSGKAMETTDLLGDTYKMSTARGFCHAVGFSVTYRF